ncbi:MAG: FliO/MopB family protein [Acidobacteriota bacterium]
MHSTGLTVLWFVVIVALIPLSLWLLKRSGLAAGAMAGTLQNVRPVSQYNIGPGQRIVTVEVGSGEQRTWLVLGVTAQSITTLHTMPPQADLPAMNAGPATAFASLLRRSSSDVSGNQG